MATKPEPMTEDEMEAAKQQLIHGARLPSDAAEHLAEHQPASHLDRYERLRGDAPS